MLAGSDIAQRLGRSWYLTLFMGLGFLVTLSSLRAQETYPFIENKGQWPSFVQFKSDLAQGHLYILDSGLTHVFYSPEALETFHSHAHAGHGKGTGEAQQKTMAAPNQNFELYALHMRYVGAKGTGTYREKAAAHYHNYFIGQDAEQWASRVGLFAEVGFQQLYPGVELKYYTQRGNLKYDLIVRPGASPEQIKMEYEGGQEISIEEGNLVIRYPYGEILEKKPFAYQIIQNDTLEITCDFQQDEQGRIFFELGAYDEQKPLVIDPILIFSTYSGSTADNWGNTATFDELGNAFSGGMARLNAGGDFPTTPGAFQRTFGGIWDCAIMKFDSTGSQLLYSTYLGGADTEIPISMVADENNELIILGVTGSLNFPISSGAYQSEFAGGEEFFPFGGSANGGVTYRNGSDLFVARLSEDGTRLLGSTYVGGSDNDGYLGALSNLTKNYGDQLRGEVSLDVDGNILVASNTASDDFPTQNAFQSSYGGGNRDAVLFKIHKNLEEMIWSSYFGGAQDDTSFSIEQAQDSSYYFVGGTSSFNLFTSNPGWQPSYSGGIDGYVVRISPKGDQILSGSYYGTALYDQGYFVELNTQGEVFILGQSRGNFPLINPGFHQANGGQFIIKFTPDLSDVMRSMRFGSGGNQPDISPTAFLVNDCDNIFVSGWGGQINSLSSNYIGGNTFGMPITNDAIQSGTSGSDFYLMSLSIDAEELLFATYLGGQGPIHVDGGTSRFDSRGIVYHAVCACRDNSTFPTTPNVWSTTNGSLGDSFQGCNNAVFKFDLATLQAAFETNTPNFRNPGITEGCVPFTFFFKNESLAGQDFFWDFGDGTRSEDKDSLFHTYTEPGVYTVRLRVFDPNTCKSEDIAVRELTLYEGEFNVAPGFTACEGDRVQLSAEGGNFYAWEPAELFIDPNVANPVFIAQETTLITVEILNNRGCVYNDTLIIDVIPTIETDFEHREVFDCDDWGTFEFNGVVEGADVFFWDFGDGTMVADELDISHQYTQGGDYTARLVAEKEGCTEIKEVDIRVVERFIPNAFTPNGDGVNDSFELITSGNPGVVITNRWGKKVFQSDAYQNEWDGAGLSTGVYYYELNFPGEVSCNGWVHLLR